MRTSRGRGLKTLKVKERKRSEPGQKQDHTRKEPGPSKITFRFLCANTFGEEEERERLETQAGLFPNGRPSTCGGAEVRRAPTSPQSMVNRAAPPPGNFQRRPPAPSTAEPLISPVVMETSAGKFFCLKTPNIPWKFHDF